MLAQLIGKLAYMSGIGDRIKLARRQAGLTQPELADLMHRHGAKVSRAAISQWERGETVSLRPEILFACADVRMLADGVIGADEVTDLAGTLSALCGIDLDQGIVSGLSTRATAEPASEVVFQGRAFCFTGRFIYGPRHTLEQEVKNRGGRVQSRVNKSLDYLVIGALASRDWAHTSHGRKIEAAKNHQNAGRPMVTLEEETWAACL